MTPVVKKYTGFRARGAQWDCGWSTSVSFAETTVPTLRRMRWKYSVVGKARRYERLPRLNEGRCTVGAYSYELKMSAECGDLSR